MEEPVLQPQVIFKHKRYSIKTGLSFQVTRGTWSVSSETPNLKLVCFEMSTTILKYLKEMSLVLIGKTGNSYLSKPEGTPEPEIQTTLKMLSCQQVSFKNYTINDLSNLKLSQVDKS